MEQLLHKIGKEYQILKNRKRLQDVYLPEINGNNDISGFNMFLGLLYASNRNLSGSYTTISLLQEKEISFKTDGPKVDFLDYEITNTILFVENQIQSFIPEFREGEQEFINQIETLLRENRINSFSPRIKEKIERDFGKVLEVNIGKSILNYRKVEAIPNEYILDMEIRKSIELTPTEERIREDKERTIYTSFEKAQQELFELLYTCKVANLKMIQNFELYELGLNIDFFIKSNNNAVIAKRMAEEIKEQKIYKIS